MTTDLNLGIEGPRVTARHLIKEGEAVFCALSWSDHPAPASHAEAYERLVWTAHHWQHWLDRGEFPDHPWRARPAALGAHAQGTHLRPDRRDRGGRDDVAARDARRRAQLGLPLLVDPRLDVRALGPLHARLRLGGERLLLLRRRRRGGRAGDAADHVRRRRPRRAARADARPSHRLREREPRARRQRGALAGPARRLGRGARLRLPAHEIARPPARARLADPRRAGRGRDGELARPRPRHVGGARGAAALHVVEADVLGRARPRRAARRDARGARQRGALARGRRRDPRRHLRARARCARRVHAALRHGGARRVRAADAAGAVPARRRRAHPRNRAGDRRRADRGRPRAALPHRADRRRAPRRGGHVHDLLVLARLGAVRDRRDRARASAVREAAGLRERPRALRRGDRHAHGPPPRQLPAGVHAPRADQRGHARDPRRGGARGAGRRT